jgi:hypothetical protein
MSPNGSYDMILLPPQHDSNDGRRLARRRRTRRRHLPGVEEGHSGLPRHPLRRRRGRRGNHGQARGSTSSAVGPEQVDGAGTPAGDMSGVILAPGTTTGVVSQQRASPRRTDDASTLARDLSGISLTPEIATRSIPTTTSPPSTNQEVPSVFHPVPFRFSFDPPGDPTSASVFARVYPNLPGYHMWSTWDLLTVASMIPEPRETSYPHVTTASPGTLTMATTLTTRLTTQLASASTSIRKITTETTTSACQETTTPLHLCLASRSRGS